MNWLGCIHDQWKEYEQAVEWYTKGAEAGLPEAMFALACSLDAGEGVAAPDYQAAADWYRQAADAGHGAATSNLAEMYPVGRGKVRHTLPATSFTHVSELGFLSNSASHTVASIICQTLRRGVTRSKRRAMQWMRKSADLCDTEACLDLARAMYGDYPYAREVGEVTGVATSAGVAEGHDVPPDVLIGVVHWLRKGDHNSVGRLESFRREALEGAYHCFNDGCEVLGQLKDFKVCPQCKTARYCGDECQKQDWNGGGHKTTCGTFSAKDDQNSRRRLYEWAV